MPGGWAGLIYSLPFSMDATEETGRLGRLINHNIAMSNLKLKAVDLGDGTPRVAMYAKRDIEPGGYRS